MSPNPRAPVAVPHPKDQIDRDLIALLQANARESTANLARKLGIARTTVVARLARLERDGVIVGYTVRLGQDDERPKVRAHVGITLQPKSSRDVLRRLQKIPELLQLSSVSGEFDYIAILRADTTAGWTRCSTRSARSKACTRPPPRWCWPCASIAAPERRPTPFPTNEARQYACVYPS